MDRWSLDVMYSDYNEEYKEDVKKCQQAVESFNHFASAMDQTQPLKTIKEGIDLLEKYSCLIDKLFSYTSLRQSVDTADSQTVAYLGQLMSIDSSITKANTAFSKYIAQVKNLEEIIEQDEKLQAYSYLLKTTKKTAEHLLSDEVEGMIAKMDITGGSAWGNLQDFLTSSLEIDFDGQKLTLSDIRNMAYNENEETRKKAYDAEIKSYEHICEPIAFSLNNIKKQVNMLAKEKGYGSVLQMTLDQAHMKKTTLDAMLHAIEKHLPKFWEYYKRKGKLLGHDDGLPWYDLFAPIGVNNQTFTPEQARDYLVEHFAKFSQDLADMVQEAFDNNWIDFFPRKGKVGGAFCANLPFAKQSRILTNFDGKLGDVVTLAHELGHAYHGYHIQNHLPLNYGYSMPVAETASTFNENLIMNAIIQDADKETKIALIETQLQDLAQIICDIYSRFLFESKVVDECENDFKFATKCCDIMLEAQKKAYGNGLSTFHPYMWCCKSHYYSSSTSFYNFPYAFGGLFARGLYAKYQEDKENFVPKYQSLLKATTISDVEDVAAICGIDLEDEKFWEDALLSCEALIDQFLELTK